ncbi:MAG: M23 family metallopeptidase [Armatimonadetes bacterium]|nr:M23 family metallopeptidase [Armatimonadota bacterium]
MVVCAALTFVVMRPGAVSGPMPWQQQQYGFPSRTTRASLLPPVAPDTTESLNTDTVEHALIFPVVGGARWHDTYNHDRGGGYRHTAQDLAASKLTPVVAPISGKVGFKTETFWIYGDDGWKCLGTHLNDDTPGTNDNCADRDFMFAPNLRFGQRVEAGQFIGYVGDSGKATGPHLHFELFSPEGLRNPLKSLQNAQVLSRPKPFLRRGLGKPQPGEERIDGCYRTWDKVNGIVSIMLLSRQEAGQEARVVTKPTFVTVKVPRSALLKAEYDNVQLWPRDRCATLYCVHEDGKLVATRIDPPGDD